MLDDYLFSILDNLLDLRRLAHLGSLVDLALRRPRDLGRLIVCRFLTRMRPLSYDHSKGIRLAARRPQIRATAGIESAPAPSVSRKRR